MATEKVLIAIHSPNDVAGFCHYSKYCCEAPNRVIKYEFDNRVKN
jgi:hypothetical protein